MPDRPEDFDVDVVLERIESEPVPCPLCGGALTLLGVLGRLEHFRCRNCGADSNSGMS